MEIVVERPTLEFESMAQMLLARKSLALVKKALEREYIHTYVYTSCRIESLLVPMISLKALSSVNDEGIEVGIDTVVMMPTNASAAATVTEHSSLAEVLQHEQPYVEQMPA